MGLLPEYRGKGLGRKLAERAISDARARGIERIELEVFASNTRAIQLYEKLGFAHEGVKRKGRKLDGAYEDRRYGVAVNQLLGRPAPSHPIAPFAPTAKAHRTDQRQSTRAH